MRDKKVLLQGCMNKAVDDKEIAGCNVLVLKDGEEQLYAEAGYANIEEDRAFSRDTIVRLYSQSKPITAAAAMLLIQDGIIEPYEPVGNYIESFKHQEIVEAGVRRPVRIDRPMLIKDLLDMTSGLVYPFVNTPAEIETGKLYDELIQRLSTDDGQKLHINNFIFAAAMIHHYEGGGFKFAPDADFSDGYFDLIVGGDMTMRHIFKVLPMGYFGKHYNQQGIWHIKAKKITINTEIPLWVHTDGEVLLKSDSITLKCLPQKLNMLL